MLWPEIIGAFAVGFLVLVVGSALARRSKGWSPRWSAKASREVSLSVPPEEALERARRALEAVKLVAEPTVSDGLLEGKTPSSWKTFGDTISIRLDRQGDGTRATVSARPTLPQKFDFGRSRSLVDAVAARLADGG